MQNNPLRNLETFGQSLWLDYIRRHLITSGELRRHIEEDGLKGVTSNPAIFEKAISGSRDYDPAVQELAEKETGVQGTYEALTIRDVQMAADVFLPLYEKLKGQDGFVSLEVNPHLARDTEGTINEARRLWHELNRPNVLIKVPATLEGLPAITQLISEGINVNVTLLFSLERYRQVAEAYIAGLERRAAQGRSLAGISSVASFFLSRIDVLVDPLLEKIVAAGGPQAELAAALRGEVAIASAKMAYSRYRNIFAGGRFLALTAEGAHPQRLLWASTSTKNPAYPDTKYVEPLIGPDTINTMPLETLNAYRDHGQPALRLEDGVDQARAVLQRLAEVGLNLDQVTRQLEEEGIEKFNKPYDSLLCILEAKRQEVLKERLDPQELALGDYGQAVEARLADFAKTNFADRLWRKDACLWTKDGAAGKLIYNSLGWLHVPEKMEACLTGLIAFTQELRQEGFKHVVHLGMGGSSLAPLVFQHFFAPGAYGLPLTVLDTTDPVTIKKIEAAVPLAQTLFIVASKSGTTAEPNAFGDYFYDKVQKLKGDKAGDNFLAITDPGSALEKLARARCFRGVFLNFPDIGGRYSALSFFGMLPAALMNLQVGELLGRAQSMLHGCSGCLPVQENPGLILGATLGELARQGRDKVTFLAPEALSPLGMWLEQLLAESTGKAGTGLLPVAGEPLGPPEVYGADRLFVYLRLRNEVSEALEQGVAALKEAGQPVVTIQLADRLDLGQEFFRWEMATAATGWVLGINPFDQPNVQESKDNTNKLLQVVREQGRLPEETPTLREGPLTLCGGLQAPTLTEALSLFFRQVQPGDFLAFLAYLSEDPATTGRFQEMRRLLRDHLQVATTLGYGPRYLHSTGQYHKGGPNKGVFLVLTADPPEDAAIPGQPYSFGVFQQAQALGDFQSLLRHGRRAVRLHLGPDAQQGLARLQEIITQTVGKT
ncbi:MAG: bifunctional transaldolase/phosoglucose isomerase [Syntrophales bacterium]|nr:bifunctional transaldolase/phosoglucose isomerase [Syntrophales bacterium]